ncbi:MAG: antitoxin VapB family protein [Candidatus Aenigmarchaeota archaeon]|nr:antitoxin VapB family protein [Candidatus Aenigmarchaeota archaeon]
MATTVSLSEEAYRALKSVQHPGQSFSDAVLAITAAQRRRALDFAGRWHGSRREMDAIFLRVATDRRRSRA